MKNAKWIGLLLGGVALAGALAPAAPEDANQGLAKEQLKLAREALSELDKLFRGGEVDATDRRIILWERRQAEATRASGAPQAEVVKAVESYVKRMKQIAQFMEVNFKRDVVTRVEVIDAQYRVLEAEMWLNQEKAR